LVNKYSDMIVCSNGEKLINANHHILRPMRCQRRVCAMPNFE